MITINHPDAEITIETTSEGKNRITVRPLNNTIFVPKNKWETNYSIELIKKILEVKGPGYLCDEIMRDEKPDYVELCLKTTLMGHVGKERFRQKRILDFGCGSGSSTMILSRLFPDATIIGIELEKNLLNLSNIRKEYLQTQNVNFFLSPSSNQLPVGLGEFDFVLLQACYEHLLPDERKNLLIQLWSVLKTEGVLFISETPYRYTPVENHTSMLPLINYMPDKIALAYARRFSKRVKKDESWESLLRRGIRGGCAKEIISILRNEKRFKPLLLKPCNLGMKDSIDLWYALSSTEVSKKRFRRFVLKTIRTITGITIVRGLNIAIMKAQEQSCTM